MTALVTHVRYQVITGDLVTTEMAATAALVDAQSLLEEVLSRELDSRERTERVYPDREGRAYPKVTPVTVPPDGMTVDGSTLYGSGPFLAVPDFIFEGSGTDVTYTGGYVERTANPDAVNRLPEHVERDLCWCAYRAVNAASFQALALAPAGASQLSVGDARIALDKGGVRAGTDALTEPVWSRQTLKLRRAGRRV